MLKSFASKFFRSGVFILKWTNIFQDFSTVQNLGWGQLPHLPATMPLLVVLFETGIVCEMLLIVYASYRPHD